MVALGRLALKDASVREVLGALSRGDAYERRLALYAQFTLRDGRQVLAATTDASARVRFLAFSLVAQVCDDFQALEALKMAYAIRGEGDILGALAGHGRRAVIDVYLDWLATRESVPEFADIVPFATPEGLRRHLPRALARPSTSFWSRLARHAPEVLAQVLTDHVKAAEGTPDPVTRLNLQLYLPCLVKQVPDAALALVELLLARGVPPEPVTWRLLVMRRPEAVVSLLQRHASIPIADGQFAHAAPKLSDDALAWLVRRAPASLGDIKKLLRRLSVPARRVLVDAWCASVDEAPAWGTELLRFVSNASERARGRAGALPRQPAGGAAGPMRSDGPVLAGVGGDAGPDGRGGAPSR